MCCSNYSEEASCWTRKLVKSWKQEQLSFSRCTIKSLPSTDWKYIRPAAIQWRDPHFVWKDIQLSKGQLNRDRLIKVEVNNTAEDMYYRSAPCLGAKYCPVEGCQHIVPIHDKRNCPKHNMPLEKSGECPVEFVYLHPKKVQMVDVWWNCMLAKVSIKACSQSQNTFSN